MPENHSASAFLNNFLRPIAFVDASVDAPADGIMDALWVFTQSVPLTLALNRLSVRAGARGCVTHRHACVDCAQAFIAF